MARSEFLDGLESREPALRESELMARLPACVSNAQESSLAYSEILQGVASHEIISRDALARLPVLRKHDLLDMQTLSRSRGASAFGGMATSTYGPLMPRVFASPGPIYEPGGRARDYWRMARPIFSAGFRAGDLVHNSFSYHFVPAGSMMETGAMALGCSVFAAGTGQTEQQVKAMADLRPAGYIGTPSFFKIILEKAQELGVALPTVRKALFGGEAYPPSLRDWFIERGVQGYQCYATADVGSIAYETSAREGLVVDEDVILEIVRPGTGVPVPDGEVGEVVVTTTNTLYPMIRFATGDLSAVLPGMCPTGRTNMRIKGWMGRADQTTKVRGMFVHPEQVDQIVRRFPEVVRARLVVSGEMANDEMTLHLESSHAASEDLSEKIVQVMREITKLRGDVRWLAPNTLPNDGKVIEDARSYK